MKRSRFIIILIAVLVIIIGVLLVLLLFKEDKPVSRRENGVQLLNFSVGEELSGYTVFDESEQELDISEIPGSNKLLIFAWDKCGDCKAEYESYRLLFPFYDTDELNIVFIWDNRIPDDDLDTLSIPSRNSYSASDKYKFTDWVPSYILVDENNIIQMKEIDLSMIITHLKANFTPNQQAFSELFGSSDLLLGVDRCSGCKSAFDELNANDEDFQYWIEGPVTSTMYEDHTDVHYDPHSILSAVFDIDSYPETIEADDFQK